MAWRMSLGAGNGVWSGVGQGEKNVLHKEDRMSKHIQCWHVQGAANSPLWSECVVSRKRAAGEWRGPCKLWKGFGSFSEAYEEPLKVLRNRTSGWLSRLGVCLWLRP